MAVSLLLNHTGNDLTALLNELDKLCAYCGKTEITEDDVRLLATRNIDVSAFDLVKAINAGRKNESIRLLHELFESRCEPVLILGALASAFVDMYRVAAAEKSGIGYMEIAKYYDYKGKDFRLKNAYRISRGMTLEQARRAILILSECDRRLKYTSIDKNTALEAAVAELMIR